MTPTEIKKQILIRESLIISFTDKLNRIKDSIDTMEAEIRDSGEEGEGDE